MAEETNGVAWSLDSYFPEFNGPLMQAFKKMIEADLADLRRKAEALPPLSDEAADRWEEILLAWESLVGRLEHLASYVGCLEAAHGDNEAYGQEQAALTVLGAAFEKLEVDLMRGLRGVEDSGFESFTARENMKPVAYFVDRLRFRASLTMSRKEELLAADLGIDGISAWGRLYDRVTSRLEFDMVVKGRTERKPISQWRALMSNPDREVGKAAFEGGNRAWEGIADTCASAINAIAGTRLTLYRRRGVAPFPRSAPVSGRHGPGNPGGHVHGDFRKPEAGPGHSQEPNRDSSTVRGYGFSKGRPPCPWPTTPPTPGTRPFPWYPAPSAAPTLTSIPTSAR